MSAPSASLARGVFCSLLPKTFSNQSGAGFETRRPSVSLLRPAAFFLAACLLVLCSALPSLAAVGTVTSLADDGTSGTLRSVIASAAAGDTVVFGVTGTIVLNCAGGGPVTISKNLAISGPGAANLAVSGNNACTVFVVNLGVTATISGLTIENGFETTGGGIYDNGTLTVNNSTLSGNSASSSSGNVFGGGIYVAAGATATVSNSTLSGNVANLVNAGGGGAIANLGTLTVSKSTFSSNSTAGGWGGGIYNGATATIINSTFSNNSAVISGQNGGQGGGVFDGGTMTLVNDTFSGNSANQAQGGGGAIWEKSGILTMKGTILANSPSGGNCAIYFMGTTATSNGYNLSDDSSCSFLTATGDQKGVSAGLDTTNGLKNNGGPTSTIALLSTSTAKDAVPASACTDTAGNYITTDQRGVSRPQGANCDIGAYELTQVPTANVCPGGIGPAPCSATITALFNIPAGVTVGSTNVLTQGTANLDFTLSSSTSTTTPPTETVHVQFAPLAPGLRMGAVVLKDTSGNLIASVPIYGIGVGSGLAFTPGIISTVAGTGAFGSSGDNGPATSAEIALPTGVVVDAAGNFYIADVGEHCVRKVDTSGTISTVAGICNGVSGYNGDGIAATSAQLNHPEGLALDGAGNLYIGDVGNNRIRMVNSTSGIITTIAGNGSGGYNGDNIPATSASLNSPSGVALDAAGNFYIAEFRNHRIRKVDISGIITTVAGNGTQGYNGDGIAATTAELNTPFGVAADSSGNIYIADTDNERIRKVGTSGIITTFAGTGTGGYNGDGIAATAAELGLPTGVAVDAAGDLYIADQSGQRVRKVDASGIITTLAGTGAASYNGDGIVATAAQLNYPFSVAPDGAGNLYIGDQEGSRVRKVNVTTSSLSFGSVSVGDTSSAQSVVVSDTGDASLNFTQPFGITSNFQLEGVGNACAPGTPLAIGASCDLGAYFAPTTTGNPLTGTLTVTDDAFNSPHTVNLSGVGVTVPVLSVSKSHSGTFTQGLTGEWDITVSNTQSGSTTSGTTTVTDTLPSGYTLNTYSGSGWSCSGSSVVTCTSIQAVSGGSTFAVLALTVNIPANSPVSVSNSAMASGGGAGASATSLTDTVTVVQVPSTVTINGSSTQNANVGTAFGSLAVTVKDAGGVVIANAPVTFAAPATGASGTFSNLSNSTTVNTNSSGVADPGTFTANAIPGGPYLVTVTAGSANTSFSLTNNAVIVGASTTTSLSSSVISSFTTPPMNVTTFTATVTDGSTVNDGTVTFSDPANNFTCSGGNTVAVSNGQATCSTSFSAEGTDKVTATYNGTVNFQTSNGSVTQTVSNHTVVTGNQYCNPGAITLPATAAGGSPYPSNIFVSGAGTSTASVTLALNHISATDVNLWDLLLIDPTGKKFVPMAGVGDASAISNVDVTLSDGASAALPSASPLTTGTYKPSDFNDGPITFFSTAPAGPYDYPAAFGTATLGSEFNSLNPNGTWQLYAEVANAGGAGSIGGGWCLNIQTTPPDLSIAKTHSPASFTQGDTGDRFTITVTNTGPVTSGGTVTVTDTLPSGLTATAATGTNWSCTVGNPTTTCTSTDSITPSHNYADITLTVNVAANATNPQNNTATVSGSGDNTLSNDTANDSVPIIAAPVLSIVKGHTGTFTQGGTGVWTIDVSNTATGSTTAGTTTVTDSLFTGYTLASYSGTGWTCTGTASVSCSSTTGVSGGSAFPTLGLTVNIPASSPSTVANTAQVSGGGSVGSPSSTTSASVVQVPFIVVKAPGSSPQSTPISNGFTNPLSVTVLDANSIPIPNYAVVFTAPGSGASGMFSNTSNTVTINTNSSGVANAGTFTANSTAGGPYSVSATAGPASTNFSLTNNPGGAATISITQGNNQSATVNNAFGTTLQVVVKDSGNNPVPGVNVTFTAPPSGASGTFTGNVTTVVIATDSTGLATEAFTANTMAGSYNVTAAAQGDGSTSFSLTNNPGNAFSITPTSGSGQSTHINMPFGSPLVATVKDNFGNVIPNASVTFSAPAGAVPSGTFSNNTTTITANTGATGTLSETFTANSTAGGPYTVSASTPGVATPANFSLTNTPGTAASITATQGSGQSIAINMPYPVQLQAVVKDSGTNPVPNVNVTFTVVPGVGGAGGTFPGNVTSVVIATDSNGLATAPTLTANSSPGTFTVTAAAQGDGSTSFSLTNLHGNPSTITTVAGSGQSATINTPFSTALQALVKDAGNNPVPGVSVTFTAPASGASGTFPGNVTSTAVMTNSSGVATAPTFTANSASGGYMVTASTAGVATPAGFSLTNVNPMIIMVNPMSLDFGTINLGDTKSMNLTVKNVSSSNMNITNINFTYGPGSGKDFGYTTQCGGAIKPGKTCTITVKLHAQDLGAGAAILNIFYNGVGSPVQVGLMGNVINPKARLNKSSLNFGNVKVGNSSTTSVTLTSSGDTPLVINSIGISGSSNFTQMNGCPVGMPGLAPNNTCTISVTFAPSTKKSLSATLKISDNASSSPQTVSLQGKGN